MLTPFLAQQLLYGLLQGLGGGHTAALVHALEIQHVLHHVGVVVRAVFVQLGVRLLDTLQHDVVAGGFAGAGLDDLLAVLGLGVADGALGAADLAHQFGGLVDLALGQQPVVLLLHTQDGVLHLRQLLVRLGDALAVLVLGQLALQGFAL